jgi:RNA polymerase sigma-70 factor (ECF subfamily)
MKPTDRVRVLAARLFQDRGQDLLRFLTQRSGSSVDARDLAQEGYLRFIRLGDPDRIENPEAYLFRIASNLLWEHNLQKRNASGGSPLQETPTVEHTPFDLAMSAEMSAELKQALDELPALQRAAFVLHLRDGLTCAEIAAQAGISASMVKKHVNAALAFCRMRLRDHE